MFYFAPLTLFFGISSLALWRKWRFALVAHWLAISGIVAIPFIDYSALMLTTHWTEHCRLFGPLAWPSLRPKYCEVNSQDG